MIEVEQTDSEHSANNLFSILYLLQHHAASTNVLAESGQQEMSIIVFSFYFLHLILLFQ
jgi:hypothetical protein